MSLCVNQKKDRSPCGAPAMFGDEKCFFHSEKKEKERLQARKKAGKTTAGKIIGFLHLPEDTPDFSLKTLDDSQDLLAKVTNYVLRGQIAPQIGNCVGYLIGGFMKAKEIGEQAERFDAIEQRLKELEADRSSSRFRRLG
jgi:hypothetical protein